MLQNRIISGLDVMKFVMAILIVDVHVKGYLLFPIPIQNNLIHPIESLTVPTFFVISSFLFFRKTRDAEHQLRLVLHFAKRLALLYVFWCLLWSPIIFLQKEYFHPMTIWVPLFLLRDFFLGSMFDASWFLGALLVGVPMVWCLSCLFKKDILVIIVPLIASLYLQNLDNFPEELCAFYYWYNTFELPQLSFMGGLLWIAVGYLLANKKNIAWMNCVSNKWAWIIFLVCFVWKSYFPVIQLLPNVFCVVALFIAAYTLKVPEHPKLYRRFRTYSILFYVINDCFKKIPKQLFGWENGPLLFVVTLAFCFLVSELIMRMKDVKGFGWLRYAY